MKRLHVSTACVATLSVLSACSDASSPAAPNDAAPAPAVAAAIANAGAADVSD